MDGMGCNIVRQLHFWTPLGHDIVIYSTCFLDRGNEGAYDFDDSGGL